jgi:hypothetical protein
MSDFPTSPSKTAFEASNSHRVDEIAHTSARRLPLKLDPTAKSRLRWKPKIKREIRIQSSLALNLMNG